MNTQNRKTTVLMGAALLTGITVGVTAVLVTGGDDTVAAPTTPTSPTQATSPILPEPDHASMPQFEPSWCGLPQGDLRVITLAQPPVTQWKYHANTAYPISDTYGPKAVTDKGVRACYQHSIEGALIAGANFVASFATLETTYEWLDQYLSEGKYKDVYLEDAKGAKPREREREWNLAAYRVQEFTPEQASITVVFSTHFREGTEEIFMSYRLPMVWNDGDWKIDGELFEPGRMHVPVFNIGDYTPWEG